MRGGIMLNRDLVNELREARFPRSGIHIGPPVLSELIKVCEELYPECQFVLTKLAETGESRWVALFVLGKGTPRTLGEGNTPEDAVARLWLRLRRTRELRQWQQGHSRRQLLKVLTSPAQGGAFAAMIEVVRIRIANRAIAPG